MRLVFLSIQFQLHTAWSSMVEAKRLTFNVYSYWMGGKVRGWDCVAASAHRKISGLSNFKYSP